MEYRRTRALSRRQSSQQSSRASALSVVVFVLVCGVIVFIFCTSQAANWLVENVFAPIFASSERVEDEKIVAALQSQDEATPAPSATPQPTYQSETETLEKRSYYFLQMGSFEDEQLAKEKAASIRGLGAAGYVHFDGDLYRVFAACYESVDDLTKVQDQVRRDGFDNTAYILHADALQMTISGEEGDVALLKRAAEWLQTLPQQLTQYALSFDRDGLTVEQGARQVEQWLQATDDVRRELDALAGEASVQPVLLALDDYASYLSTFPKMDDTMNSVAFSASLKALQIQTIVRYCAITGQDME